MSVRDNDPKKEGHTREWQDRARVVLNAKEDAQNESKDKQSPLPGEGRNTDDEQKLNRNEKNDDPVY
jgi:hypothetical protein